MGYKNMRLYSPPHSPDFNERAWEYEEELSSPGAGNWVLRPSEQMIMAAMLIIEAASSGYIEITLDSLEAVQNDTAETIAWPAGVVTTTSQSTFTKIKALRQVNVSGTTKLRVEA